MHETSLQSGKLFCNTYGNCGLVVVDIGGRDVNGSLRKFFESKHMKYICVDMEPDGSVDVVVRPSDKLPFADGSIDIVVSTSCFEHDPCFWLTFKEMARITKLNGYIYVNAPTRGPYHCYPGDNWRFYSDAGQALAYWSGIQMGREDVSTVSVVETFNIVNNEFDDFVCIWQRTLKRETHITTQDDILNIIGPLEKELNKNGYATKKKC
jgi:SAM-dependent methyltransferase